MTDSLQRAKQRFITAKLRTSVEATSISLHEAKLSLLQQRCDAGPEPELAVTDAFEQIRRLRGEVAQMTVALRTAEEPLFFDDLFVGPLDAVTGVPAPPGPEGLRRLHKQHFDASQESQFREDLDGLLTHLAEHNRTRGLDGLSSIQGRRAHEPRSAPQRLLTEIECQVLLSYVMQACATLDPNTEGIDLTGLPQDSTQEPAHGMSLNATSIAAEHRVVDHESRVAGGRVSSGSKSSPLATATINRSRSTPSSANRPMSSASIHQSVASVASHRQSSSPTFTGGPPRRLVSPNMGNQSVSHSRDESSAVDASHYGFETRGNVRFDESSVAPQPQQSTTQVDNPSAALAVPAEDGSPSATVASNDAAESGFTRDNTDAERPADTTAQASEGKSLATEPSILRKPTGKFGKKTAPKKSFFSCFGDDT